MFGWHVKAKKWAWPRHERWQTRRRRPVEVSGVCVRAILVQIVREAGAETVQYVLVNAGVLQTAHELA